MEGWRDGAMDGWTDRRMEGWTNGRIEGWRACYLQVMMGTCRCRCWWGPPGAHSPSRWRRPGWRGARPPGEEEKSRRGEEEKRRRRGKGEERRRKEEKLRKERKNQFWNQFWSLIPKLFSDFCFQHQKYHFFGTQKYDFRRFRVPQKWYFWC